MATPRERLEELRALEAAAPPSPRARLDQLQALEAQEIPEKEELTTGEFAVGAGQSLLQGATLGFSDEVQSLIAATVASPFVSDKTFSQLMVDARQSLREEQEQFREEAPGTALGLELAGGLATGGAGLARAAGKQALGRTIAKGAATGAITGGVAGAGLADVDEFASTETLEKAGVGAAVGGVVGAVATPLIGAFKNRTAFKEKIAQQIESGSTDKAVAKYIIDGSGKVKTDKFAQESIKQGFDEGVVAAIKGSTRNDKIKMGRMLDVVKKGRVNALFASKNRPSDIAGNTLLERVNHIKRVNVSSGKRLDSVAKGLKGKQVDSTEPVNNFISSLDDMGIALSDDLRPQFQGSIIEGLTGPENAIKNIVKRLASGQRGQAPDAFELHRMKKFIDEQVTFGKTAEGLSGKTEQVLKKLRSDIDRTLDSNFPKYDKVNTAFSETINALDSLQGVAGGKMDLFGPNANKAVGTLLRGLMSNIKSRVRLVDAVDEIEAVSKKLGGKFKDDVNVQMLFADELNTIFKPAARTSLQGELQKEIARGARGRTLVETVAEGAGKLAEKARGISDENAIKAIDKVLKR